MTVFGYLILINIDFYDFLSPLSPYFWFRLRRYITKDSVEPHFQNTSTFFNNTIFRVIFSTLSSLCLEISSNTLFDVLHKFLLPSRMK